MRKLLKYQFTLFSRDVGSPTGAYNATEKRFVFSGFTISINTHYKDVLRQKKKKKNLFSNQSVPHGGVPRPKLNARK